MYKSKGQENMQSKYKSEENVEIIQRQEARENSQQIQVGTVVFQQGIDEKRAREIFLELFDNTKKELTKDACFEANRRIAEFEKVLMPKVLSVEGALEAFADPGFQKLLSKSHTAAIGTDRKEDYELLGELLMHRVKNKGDRIKYTGISKAVEIIDYVDDEALLGMTLAHAIGRLRPLSGNVKTGLKTLDDLYGKLIDGELPSGGEWLHHLDLLDCVRVNSNSTLKKLEDYLFEDLDGYACTGIKANSEDFVKVQEILGREQIPSYFLHENPLLEGYYILNIEAKRRIDNLNLIHNNVSTPLSYGQKECILCIYDMYDKDMALIGVVKQKFKEEIDAMKNLQMVKNWWNEIPVAFDITASGRVLAHANAMRMDSDIPPLD